MEDLHITRIAGPKRVVGGRMSVFASLYRVSDGRILQGLGKCPRDTDHAAHNHAYWRACEGHGTDEGKSWFEREWAKEVAAQRER